MKKKTKLSTLSQMYLDSITSDKQIVSTSDTVKLDTYNKIKIHYEEETGEYVVLPVRRSTNTLDELFW